MMEAREREERARSRQREEGGGGGLQGSPVQGIPSRMLPRHSATMESGSGIQKGFESHNEPGQHGPLLA